MAKRSATQSRKTSPVLVTSTAAILGLVIVMLRKHMTYSQSTLATMMRISLSSLGRIERGETDMSVHELLLAAHALEIDPEGILTAVRVGWEAAAEKGLEIMLGVVLRRDASVSTSGVEIYIDGTSLSKLIRDAVAEYLFSSIG